MNVLFLDQFSEIGGAQLCLLDLLSAVKERGWRAEIAVPGDGPLIGRLRSLGVKVHEICCGPYRSGRKSVRDVAQFGFDLPRQARCIARLMDETGCHLIYVNGPRLLPAAALAAGRRIPVLFHAHNDVGRGYAARLVRWGVRRRRATVIACSNFVAEPLRDCVTADRLHVIANGTADMGFRDGSVDSPDGFRIGVIGRISREKGQAEFLRAAQRLVNALPAVRFVICGAPFSLPDDYYEQVRNLARDLPVDFFGWRDDVGAVLRELNVLVIPSKQEGLPRVLLEAFSAGVPVVAFPAGGIVEAIEDGRTGFLVHEPASDALATRLRELIEGGPAPLREVAWNARHEWERRYRLDLYQQRIMDLMQSVVSGN